MNWPEGKENICRKTSTWMTPTWGQNHGLFRASCHSVTAESSSPLRYTAKSLVSAAQGKVRVKDSKLQLRREPKQPCEWEPCKWDLHTWDPQVRQTALSEYARVST